MSALPAISLIDEPAKAASLIDATRRTLLAHLRKPQSAAGLARVLGVPRQRLNYHLRELERAGLVECVGEQRRGNCNERLLRTTADSFVISPSVLGSLGSTRDTADRQSAAALVAAAAETLRSIAALERRAASEGRRYATLTLETTVRFASAEARTAFAAELTDTVARLVARFHDDHAPDGRSFRLVVGTHPTLPDSGS